MATYAKNCDYSSCYCDRLFNPTCSDFRENTCFIYLVIVSVIFGIIIIYFSWTLFKENGYSLRVKQSLKDINARTMIILFLYLFLLSREIRQILQVTRLMICEYDYYIFYYIAFYFLITTFTVIIYLWMKLANTLNCFSMPEIIKIRNYIIAIDFVMFFPFCLVGVSQLFLTTLGVIIFGNLLIAVLLLPIFFFILTRNIKIQNGLRELRESFTNPGMVFYGQKIQQVTTRVIYLLLVSFTAATVSAIVTIFFDVEYYTIALWELIFRILEILVCLTFMPIVFKKKPLAMGGSQSQSQSQSQLQSKSTESL